MRPQLARLETSSPSSSFEGITAVSLPSPPRGPYGMNKLRETWVVAEGTRKSMRSNRATGTKPEVTLRKALWHAGLRGYRKNVRTLPGTPDVVFGRSRLVVFLHGCYWHGCPSCNIQASKTNSVYWQAKIQGNRDRNVRNRLILEGMDYQILVVWECELRQNVQAAVERVKEALTILGSR